MGVYFVLYFVALFVSIMFYYLSNSRRNRYYENLSTFSLILMVFFLLFALFTKDPIDEILTTIPAFWQFMIASLSGAFAIWKTYLNPLKERVIRVETNVASLDSKVDMGFSSIKEDLTMIKQFFMKKK